ncbi:MAG: serine protease [Pseudomonadota bacterium]
MTFPRPPDWLAYLAVVFGLILIAVAGREHSDAPPAPPPMPAQARAILEPASPFGPALVVKAPIPAGPGAGTAFSVADGGVWLTARHVVEGCARVAVLVAPGRCVAAETRLDPGSETALLITKGGAPGLPLAPETALRRGSIAFHPGFPHGEAGEAASRLVGRDKLRVRGRGAGAEPVLAWAEIGRTAGLAPGLAGLSGAPALDGAGRVIGVTIAEAPRRGRLYTTTPQSLRAALAAAGVKAPGAAVGESITAENYGRVADDLRRDLRVAPVVCLAS